MTSQRNRLTGIVLSLAATVLLLGGALWAQDTPLFRSESHLVDFTIGVRDADGKPVTDLQQNDLSIREDGEPQAVRFFSRVGGLPLRVGLLLDVSGSQEQFLKKHERDVETFLKQILEPQDQAFLVCFGNHLRLASDWTASPQAVEAALQAFDSGDRHMPVIGPDEDRELGTALYDAVYFAITEKLAAQHGATKILVVFSDGEENSSEHDLLDAIAAAQDTNVLIYGVRYTDAPHGNLNARNRYGMRVMDHLSQQTGARVYDAKQGSLQQAFAQIAADVRSLYSVAYQSTHHERDGQFRKVVITVDRPGATVRARAGYFAR